MLINNAVPKTYTYKLSFKGKDNYVASSASVKVTIKKATPKFIAKAKAFKLADQTKKICCDFQGQ